VREGLEKLIKEGEVTPSLPFAMITHEGYQTLNP